MPPKPPKPPKSKLLNGLNGGQFPLVAVLDSEAGIIKSPVGLDTGGEGDRVA